jgi:hypothetical protein
MRGSHTLHGFFCFLGQPWWCVVEVLLLGTKTGKIPSGPRIRKMCEDIACFGDYMKLRERYKLEGLLSREAIERAFIELNIAERWKDWRQRQTQSAILGSNVPLTPTEIREIKPDFQSAMMTSGAPVGEQVLSLPEQIRWVKQQLAKVRNGGDHPGSFPNADVLYWYQIAVSRPTDFDKIVLKIESPKEDTEDAMMRDGEYQFSQIETQLKQALQEVGKQLRELEADVAETLDGLVQACPEGSGVEPAISA